MTRVLGCCLGICLVVGTVDHARADFIAAVDYFGPVDSFGTTAGATLGYSFFVGPNPVTIDAIGLRVITTPPAVGTVRLFQDGTTINLLSELITAGDPPDSIGRYRYRALATAITLLAHTKYEIVAGAISPLRAKPAFFRSFPRQLLGKWFLRGP